MKTVQLSRALRVALIGAATTGAANFALADVKNYEFELVEPTVKAGPDKTITVKLVDKTTGKAIPDAGMVENKLVIQADK